MYIAKNHPCSAIEVADNFAAAPARSHNVETFRTRSCHRNNGLDLTMSVCHGMADCRHFPAHIRESDIRFNVDPRENLS